MGSLFGGPADKPGNIAGFVIAISAVGVICVLVWLPEGGSLSKKDAVTALGGLITLALGYVFGRGNREP